VDESTLQDGYTDNDTTIATDGKEGMQDKQPMAADTVNIIE